MELNRGRYKRKCPFCGEICEGDLGYNLFCKCGAKYYYYSDTWLERKGAKETRGDLWNENRL